MTGSGPEFENWVHEVTEEVLRRLGLESPGDAGGNPPGPAEASPGLRPDPLRPGKMYEASLASLIDHTILKPDATEGQIRDLCREAVQYRFAAVCIQPMWVPLAARLLEETRVKVCTVVGFPLGAADAGVKAHETRVAVAQGAREIDMVIPVGAMKAGQLDTVRRHVAEVVAAVRAGVLTKVILETALLTDDEKRAACRICREEGADFVKTSTGFGPAGAKVEDVRLMRAEVGPTMGVKAAGGIRDRVTALAMVEAGATRIGASASVKIVTEISP